MENELYQLKGEYNNTLNRYYNGCNYLEEHINEENKYMPLLLELLAKIEKLIDKIQKIQVVTTEEILGGFKIE